MSRQALFNILADLGVKNSSTSSAASLTVAPGLAVTPAATPAVNPGGSSRQQPRVLVFVAEIKNIRALGQCLKRHGYKCGTLHGTLIYIYVHMCICVCV